MISVLKEHDQGFEFPKKQKLTVFLADLLEPDVEERFYKKPETYAHLKDVFPELNISYCIEASYWKGISPDLFIRDKKRTLVKVGLTECGGPESNRRIYDPAGIAPSLTAMQGGDRSPKILEVRPFLTPDRINKNQNGRRIKDDGEPAFTVTVKDPNGVAIGNEEIGFKVRCLTPLECWRLMGFKDEDYHKAKNSGLSATKLYERAGRGIVVPMLEEIFRNLFHTQSFDIQHELF